MFRLTCIDTDNGELTVYINNHFLASEAGCGGTLYLRDILEQLALIPGVEKEILREPLPTGSQRYLNDITTPAQPPVFVSYDDVTVAGLIARLQQYPPDALCLGTFWLEDDFLSLDGSLTEAQIDEAMRICHHNHDAGVGFNWDTLQFSIECVKGR